MTSPAIQQLLRQPCNFLNLVDSVTVFNCCRRVAMTGSGAAVYSFEGKQRVRPVTNLGWLLRNWREVHDLHVWTFHLYSGVDPGEQPRYEAVLAARMVGCRVYATTYASKSGLAQWLNRPIFKGRPVYWNSRAYVVGSTDYLNDFVRN